MINRNQTLYIKYHVAEWYCYAVGQLTTEIAFLKALLSLEKKWGGNRYNVKFLNELQFLLPNYVLWMDVSIGGKAFAMNCYTHEWNCFPDAADERERSNRTITHNNALSYKIGTIEVDKNSGKAYKMVNLDIVKTWLERKENELSSVLALKGQGLSEKVDALDCFYNACYVLGAQFDGEVPYQHTLKNLMGLRNVGYNLFEKREFYPDSLLNLHGKDGTYTERITVEELEKRMIEYGYHELFN